MAAYSSTPLIKKLGIKPGTTVVAINAPANYRNLLGKFPPDARLTDRLVDDLDFVHFFTARRSDLQERLLLLRGRLRDTGIVWVSWPKKSAGVSTDGTG